MGIFTKIFDLIFPPRCVCCERLGYFICPSCKAKISYLLTRTTPPQPLDSLYAVAHFNDPVIKEAILAFKYQKLSAMAPELSDMLAQRIKKEKIRFDILAFVPISRRRKAWRGFNQSEVLARELGRKLNKPIFLELKKTKETKTQVGLGKRDREKNLLSAFSCDDWEKRLKGKRILLIDDVATTGATIIECAKTLKKSGAKSVAALVLARE